MAAVVKSLIEQNKAVMEIIKFQYDLNETPGPSNLAKRPSKNPAISSQTKLPSLMVLISRSAVLASLMECWQKEALVPKAIMYIYQAMLIKVALPVLAALRGCWPIVGACSENDNIHLSNDIDLPTNVEENDNLSFIENIIINDDNLLYVDFALGPDNDKTLNIFGEERVLVTS